MENEEKKPSESCCGCESCDKCKRGSEDFMRQMMDFLFPKIPLEFVNESPNPDPKYAEEGDSCFDIAAWVDSKLYDEGVVETDDKGEFIRVKPMQCLLIHTGLYFKVPGRGMELQTRSRSGKSLNFQLIVLNSPGTIDQGYRGETGIIIMNLGSKEYIIRNGDTITQCGLYPVFNEPMVKLTRVDKIDKNTKRAAQAFGHSDEKQQDKQ